VLAQATVAQLAWLQLEAGTLDSRYMAPGDAQLLLHGGCIPFCHPYLSCMQHLGYSGWGALSQELAATRLHRSSK